MKNYILLLDESGEFKEGVKSTKPSIVAGLLKEGELPSEEWARGHLFRAKQSRAEYASIDIHRLHGMETNSSVFPAFVTDLLCALVDDGGTIVSFKNEKGRVIVNNDITYLNVLAGGVAILIRELLKMSEEDISLHILYAQRTNMTKKERGGRWEPIMEDEYTIRIRERIELLLAKLPSTERRRIGQRVTLERSIATRNSLLMLADAICYALRGGKNRFDAEQKARIRALRHFSFPVLEKETWEMIQDALLQNHYAEAIFLWYGGFRKELPQYQEELHRQLVQYFSVEDVAEQEIDAAILSQYLQQLVRRGNYALAKQYIAAMDADFFPLMRGNNISLDRLYFDLHFHSLTIATHEGDYAAEAKEIETCREELQHFPPAYETLDYYLKYKLREVEHLKNCYDFQRAASELEKLAGILTNMVELVQMIDDLEGFADGMTSGTLGRVFGSLSMTRCFLGLSEAKQFDDARTDLEKSMRHFSGAADRQRAAQNKAAIAYWSGEYEEALASLSLAFGTHETADAHEVLNAILREGHLMSRRFGLMHYASVMARAMLSKHPLGNEMFDVWERVTPDLGGDDAHPVYITLWRLAECATVRGEHKSAKEHYNRAIRAAMRNWGAFASIAAGLAMQMERIALISNEKMDAYVQRLQKDYESFMASEAPEAMKSYFAPWRELVKSLRSDTVAERKPDLLRLSSSMPIL